MKTILLNSLARAAECYASADLLADDLRRLLLGDPIVARPPTSSVRRKWAGYMCGAGHFRPHDRSELVRAMVASLGSQARLRSMNLRLEREIERSDHNAQEAREQARAIERFAVGCIFGLPIRP